MANTQDVIEFYMEMLRDEGLSDKAFIQITRRIERLEAMSREE